MSMSDINLEGFDFTNLGLEDINFEALNMNDSGLTQVDCEDGSSWYFQSPYGFEDFPLDIGSTFRLGGHSKEPFASFNLAQHIGDNPADVNKNRQQVADYLGVDSSRITCANQIHGLRAVKVDASNMGAGAFDAVSAIPDCDAIYTNIPNIPLLLFTADCVPVAIYDKVNKAVAVVHAGWKGAIGRLPSITLKAMTKDFGTRPKDCYCFLGPSIGPESFEVGVDLAQRFQEAGPQIDNLVTMIQRPGADKATPHINLWAFIKNDLMDCGVPEGQITIGGIDSLTDNYCFSYRREHGKTGRMALFTMIRP